MSKHEVQVRRLRQRVPPALHLARLAVGTCDLCHLAGASEPADASHVETAPIPRTHLQREFDQLRIGEGVSTANDVEIERI